MKSSANTKKNGTFNLSHQRTVPALPISWTLQISNIHSHTTMLDELSHIIKTGHSFRKKTQIFATRVMTCPPNPGVFWVNRSSSTSQQKWPNGLLVRAAKSSKNSSKLKSPSPLKSKPGGLRPRSAKKNHGSRWFDSSTPSEIERLEPEKWWVFQKELPDL